MIGERMRELRKHLKMSQFDLGEKLGIKASAISQMENGHIRPALDTLGQMSELFGVNLHWLITGTGSMYLVTGTGEGGTEQRLQKIRDYLSGELDALVRAKADIKEGETIDLRVVGEIAAGEPAESIDTSFDVVTVRRGMIHGIEDDFICLRVNGRSMEPLVLHNDLVVIRRNQDWEKLAGHVCALRIDGAITLKRLTLDARSKMIVLVSINEEYQPILINPREHQDVTLIGQLFYLYRKL